jgi:hypothetical protein
MMQRTVSSIFFPDLSLQQSVFIGVFGLPMTHPFKLKLVTFLNTHKLLEKALKLETSLEFLLALVQLKFSYPKIYKDFLESLKTSQSAVDPLKDFRFFALDNFEGCFSTSGNNLVFNASNTGKMINTKFQSVLDFPEQQSRDLVLYVFQVDPSCFSLFDEKDSLFPKNALSAILQHPTFKKVESIKIGVKQKAGVVMGNFQIDTKTALAVRGCRIKPENCAEQVRLQKELDLLALKREGVSPIPRNSPAFNNLRTRAYDQLTRSPASVRKKVEDSIAAHRAQQVQSAPPELPTQKPRATAQTICHPIPLRLSTDVAAVAQPSIIQRPKFSSSAVADKLANGSNNGGRSVLSSLTSTAEKLTNPDRVPSGPLRSPRFFHDVVPAGHNPSERVVSVVSRRPTASAASAKPVLPGGGRSAFTPCCSQNKKVTRV